MNINKEAVKKVASAMTELARQPSSIYNYNNIINRYKIAHENDKERLDGIMICCPFHNDEDPSLSIKLDRMTWYCYGCNKTGDVLQFLVELQNLYGDNTNRASLANSLIKKDQELRRLSGVDSVYSRYNSNSAEFKPVNRGSFKIQESAPLNFSELATFIKRKKYDNDVIEKAILLMQEGLDVAYIYKEILNDFEIKNEIDKNENSMYSLDSLWE